MTKEPALLLIGFGQRLRDGRRVSAADVTDLTLADLDGSFARVASTEDILTWLA